MDTNERREEAENALNKISMRKEMAMGWSVAATQQEKERAQVFYWFRSEFETVEILWFRKKFPFMNYAAVSASKAINSIGLLLLPTTFIRT